MARAAAVYASLIGGRVRNSTRGPGESHLKCQARVPQSSESQRLLVGRVFRRPLDPEAVGKVTRLKRSN